VAINTINEVPKMRTITNIHHFSLCLIAYAYPTPIAATLRKTFVFYCYAKKEFQQVSTIKFLYLIFKHGVLGKLL